MGLLNGIVDKKHILLVGSPRVGSTWLGKILSVTMEYSHVHHPDNEKHSFFAYYAKQGLPRFPYLKADELNAKLFELYQMAFYQAYITSDSYSNQYLNQLVKLKPDLVEDHLTEFNVNPTRKLNIPFVIAHLFPKQLGNRNNRVVNTVLGTFIADYILTTFNQVRPVFMIRHPGAIVASLLRNNNKDIDRKLYLVEKLQQQHPQLRTIQFDQQKIEFLAGVQVGLFYHEFSRLIKKYPKAVLVHFEDLVEDPFLYSYNLYERLEIQWNEDVELFIANTNRKKSAEETRRFSKEQAYKWKNELTVSQIEQIKFGYQLINNIEFYPDF